MGKFTDIFRVKAEPRNTLEPLPLIPELVIYQSPEQIESWGIEPFYPLRGEIRSAQTLSQFQEVLQSIWESQPIVRFNSGVSRRPTWAGVAQLVLDDHGKKLWAFINGVAVGKYTPGKPAKYDPLRAHYDRGARNFRAAISDDNSGFELNLFAPELPKQ